MVNRNKIAPIVFFLAGIEGIAPLGTCFMTASAEIPPIGRGCLMKRKFLCLASSALMLICMALVAPPASAATPMTFSLTAGALSISTPTASVSLGSQVASTTSSSISGSLGVVTVTDQRGGVTTWTTSAISTAFTPPAGPADPASNVSYGAGTITVTGAVVATVVDASNLTGVSTVVTGASPGVSTASWNPTIS